LHTAIQVCAGDARARGPGGGLSLCQAAAPEPSRHPMRTKNSPI
jgi:hypothetical protein